MPIQHSRRHMLKLISSTSEVNAVKHQSRFLLGTAFFCIAADCATSAPYKVSGPSMSSQGIQVDILSLHCSADLTDSPMTEFPPENRGMFALTLQLANSSQRIAEFFPNRIRLVDTVFPTAPPNPPDVPDLVFVHPGQTRLIPLIFTTSNVPHCEHLFELQLANGVQLGAPPIALQSISIQPSD